MFRIVFYRTGTGRCPVEEYLDSLSGKQAQKVAWVLRLIEDLESVPAQFLKKLSGTDDLWEVRVRVGRDQFRLLGFFDNDSNLVLLHAFAKKTTKIPRKAIMVAENRKNAYRKTGGQG